MQKRYFFDSKMAAFSQNLEHLGRNFALHSETTQVMCMQNIIEITVIIRVQRFEHTFCLQRRRRLQTYQTYIDPTLHVGPNNKQANLHLITAGF